MVDAVLLELEGVVFDTHELRRIALQDALRRGFALAFATMAGKLALGGR